MSVVLIVFLCWECFKQFDFFYYFLCDKVVMSSFVVFVLFVIVVISVFLIVFINLYDFLLIDIMDVEFLFLWMEGGNEYFLLGIDEQGCDIFLIILYGLCLLLIIGFLVVGL